MTQSYMLSDEEKEALGIEEGGILRENLEALDASLNEPDETESVQGSKNTQQPSTQESSYMVDGDDIRNHSDYEYARMDIPWNEELEGKGPSIEMAEVYDRSGVIPIGERLKSLGQHPILKGKESSWYTGPDGKVDANTAYRIWLTRKHAMTKQGDFGLEVANSIKKGSIDFVSSVLTAPERGFDMVTGRMKNSGKGYMIDAKTGEPYKPDWDPLGGIKDPWNNSWWGKLTQGITHYGLGARFMKGVGINNFILQEGAFAAVSEYSQGPNVARQLQDRVPWTEAVFGAIATGDYDHPLVVTFKHVVEEMSFAKLFDFVAGKFGGKQGALVAEARKNDVHEQIRNKGQEELLEEINLDRQLTGPTVDVDVLPDPGVIKGDVQKLLGRSRQRGHAHKPLSQPGQGSPNSFNKSKVGAVRQSMREVPNTGGAPTSIDWDLTPSQAKRMAENADMSIKEMQKMARELLGETGFKNLIRDMKKNRRTWTGEDGYSPVFARVRDILGRNTTAETIEEFWEPVLKDAPWQSGTGPLNAKNIEALESSNVLVVDLVNAAIFKKLRNLAIAARELDGEGIWAADGLMKAFEERLIFGLQQAKLSRYAQSSSFKALDMKAKKVAAYTARSKELHEETVQNVRLMMEFLKENDGKEIAEGILEVFSMNNKIQNWMDFDKYFRNIIWGGKDFNGKRQTGLLIKELQRGFVNSILSGPKTVFRALVGTGSNTFFNNVQTLIGATVRSSFTGDVKSIKGAGYGIQSLFEIMPDAWKVFQHNLNSNFSKDLADISTRYTARSNDANWEAIGEVFRTRLAENPNKIRAAADMAAYNLASTAKGLNENRLFSWSPRVLAATDDTFKYIMAKSRSREVAFRQVMDGVEGGRFKEVTEDLLKQAEELHFQNYIDEAGDLNIKSDDYLNTKFKEVTLTTELKGISNKLEELFTVAPQLRPFFLFARTGINGLMINAKNMPVLGAILEESQAILRATPNKLDDVFEYGIKNAEDLAQAKNLIIGRQVTGTAVMGIAIQAYLNGHLTGNGPSSGAKRSMWKDVKWQRNMLRVGPVEVGYETLEPFNLILSAIADIGDNLELMGPEWAENQLGLVSLAVASGITNKTYLQGLSQLVSLLQGERGAGFKSVLGNIANNTFPMASARNEMGKFLNPIMREINSGIFISIRNRNLFMESLAPSSIRLDPKYDMLTGQLLRDWNIFERIWNAGSPVNLRIAPGPGRQLLFNSNYNLRLSVTSTPFAGGPSLAKEPRIRSLFQKAIGDYRDYKGRNLEEILADMSKRADIKKSVVAMERMLRRGLFVGVDENVQDFPHNREIKDIFDTARRDAWSRIENHPDVINLMNRHNDKIVKSDEKFQQIYNDYNEQPTFPLKNK